VFLTEVLCSFREIVEGEDPSIPCEEAPLASGKRHTLYCPYPLSLPVFAVESAPNSLVTKGRTVPEPSKAHELLNCADGKKLRVTAAQAKIVKQMCPKYKSYEVGF
jgi:hypothetical protein